MNLHISMSADSRFRFSIRDWLFVVWTISLLVGGVFAIVCKPLSDEVFSFLITSHLAVLAIAGEFLVLLCLPAALAFFRISSGAVVFLFAMVRGFALGFISLVCLVKQPFSGWLYSAVLQFSNIALSVPLMLFWSLCLSNEREKVMNRFWVFVLLFIFISAFDCIVVDRLFLTLF